MKKWQRSISATLGLQFVVAVVFAIAFLAAPKPAQAYCTNTRVCYYSYGRRYCTWRRRCYGYRVRHCTYRRSCYQRRYCTYSYGRRYCYYRTYCRPYRTCY